MLNNKIKIGKHELTLMFPSQNPHFSFKEGKIFCNNEFLISSENCTIEIYSHGILVISNENVDITADDGSRTYTFFNNQGQMVYYAQNYDSILLDDDTEIHEVNATINITPYEEMLISQVFDGQNYIAKAVDYNSGKGFCGDRIVDVCDDVINFKNEDDLSV